MDDHPAIVPCSAYFDNYAHTLTNDPKKAFMKNIRRKSQRSFNFPHQFVGDSRYSRRVRAIISVGWQLKGKKQPLSELLSAMFANHRIRNK